jgi:glycerol-3-phosphate acyltransferase PlsY
MLKYILLIVSYLLGSIPFGFLVAYGVKRVDIRKFGSGNIGATNVVRIVGKKWGILVFVLDFLKGLAGPCLIAYLAPNPNDFIIILGAVLAVCGHNWTIFLKFRGGKGVSTSLGAVAGLGFVFPNMWLVLLISLAVWLIVFRISKYVSIASLGAAASLFISSLFLSLPTAIKVFSLLLFVFIVIRHKKNIQDFLKEREKRF